SFVGGVSIADQLEAIHLANVLNANKAGHEAIEWTRKFNNWVQSQSVGYHDLKPAGRAVGNSFAWVFIEVMGASVEDARELVEQEKFYVEQASIALDALNPIEEVITMGKPLRDVVKNAAMRGLEEPVQQKAVQYQHAVAAQNLFELG